MAREDGLILAFSAEAAEPVRLAVVITSNVGATHEERLSYADQDGRRLADVLGQIGGYAPGDVWIVPDATVDAVTTTLARVTVRASEIESAGRSASLLVYYAGHAGIDGLHLHGDVLSLVALKTAARVVPAEERIFVVDACQAGQIARSRGASLVEVSDGPDAFLPPDDEAWLVSSGPEEKAFEVEDRRGALFTHYVISGARGAADADGDRRITLGELYGYAGGHTAEAAAGIGQVQQPRWAGRLGAFMLTDLARSPTGVRVIGPVRTPLWMVDRKTGTIAAEVPAGAGATVALPKGRYQVISAPDAGRVEFAEIDVTDGWTLWEAGDHLRPSRGVRTRGGLVDARPTTFAAGYRLALGNTTGRVDGHSLWVGAETSLGRGVKLGLVGTALRAPFQGDWWSGTDTVLDGRVTLRVDLLDGPVSLGPGVAAGAGWMSESAARSPHPLWGAWYGADKGTVLTSGPVALGEVGGEAGMAFGRVAALAWIGVGPRWSAVDGWTVAPEARVGLSVSP